MKGKTEYDIMAENKETKNVAYIMTLQTFSEAMRYITKKNNEQEEYHYFIRAVSEE